MSAAAAQEGAQRVALAPTASSRIVTGGRGGTPSTPGLGGVHPSSPANNGQPGVSGTGGAGGPGIKVGRAAAEEVAATSEAAEALAAPHLGSAGGGGGSSFAVSSATGVTHTQGDRAGNGEVLISLVGSGMTLPDGTFRFLSAVYTTARIRCCRATSGGRVGGRSIV